MAKFDEKQCILVSCVRLKTSLDTRVYMGGQYTL